MTDDQSSTQPRVGHCKTDSTDVYIGRSRQLDTIETADSHERGWLGNPFVIASNSTNSHETAEQITIVDTREESLRRFRDLLDTRLQQNDDFRRAVASLTGQVLGGWCRSRSDAEPACHGDEIAAAVAQLASDSPSRSNPD